MVLSFCIFHTGVLLSTINIVAALNTNDNIIDLHTINERADHDSFPLNCAFISGDDNLQQYLHFRFDTEEFSLEMAFKAEELKNKNDHQV